LTSRAAISRSSGASPDWSACRFRRLPRDPGSAVGWENHRLPGTTAFVVELPAGSLSSAAADRYARAVLALPDRR
jgi:hypothetical protein